MQDNDGEEPEFDPDDVGPPPPPRVGDDEERVRFRNFKPRRWDNLVENAEEEEAKVVHAPKPTEAEGEWKERWTDWTNGESAEGEEVRVKRRTETMVRVRKTADGLDRERIEIQRESWAWW